MDAPDTALLTDRPADGVLRLRLNRPARRNAIDRPLVDALLEAFSAVDASAVVLGSTSRESFSAGADISIPDEGRAEVSDLLYELYGRMVALPVPIVAALDGHAVGGGAQLAVASDLRVAGRGLRLRFAGPGHGLAVGAWALPSLVGRGRAIDLCLTMRPVGAEEALAIGLVDRVEEDAGAAAVALAQEIAGLQPAAVARVKGVAGAASARAGALEEERRGNRKSWTGSVAGLRREGAGAALAAAQLSDSGGQAN